MRYPALGHYECNEIKVRVLRCESGANRLSKAAIGYHLRNCVNSPPNNAGKNMNKLVKPIRIVDSLVNYNMQSISRVHSILASLHDHIPNL